jgi:hypothetical protein
MDNMLNQYMEEYSSGSTINEICNKYNVSFLTVTRMIRESGSQKWRNVTKLERAQLKSLYKLGYSIQRISNETGHSLSAVYNAISYFSRKKRIYDVSKFATRLKKLSQFDIGYIVGIFEGEGNIGIIHEKDKKTDRYRATITVANCSLTMVEYLRNKIQANIHKNMIHKNRLFSVVYTTENKKNWLPLYEWRLCDKKLLYELCLFLEPYMISKKREIVILKQFCMTDPKNIIERDRLYLEMKKVKSKKNTKVKV